MKQYMPAIDSCDSPVLMADDLGKDVDPEPVCLSRDVVALLGEIVTALATVSDPLADRIDKAYQLAYTAMGSLANAPLVTP